MMDTAVSARLRALNEKVRQLGQEVEKIRAHRFELMKAGTALYTAGRWESPTVEPNRAAELWMNLRDALRLPAGTATALGLGAVNATVNAPESPEAGDSEKKSRF